MSQFFISLFLNVWLVIAVILFAAIVWQSYRPSARARMERHAQIPFQEHGGGQ
ncbi:cbb3-type cytochrome c oxidase subunit 3 [Pannonibacter phragmitetus]|uniref:cbb3-type cytochrome c oxidase subunit 3 n=1 Tax=Pannonibacter phragmitetus TaxID=121719 RepID=UPI003D2F5042